MIDSRPFDADVLDLLDRTREVDVETWSPAGHVRRTTVWVIVTDGVPYIRSWRGERGRWFRDLRREPHGALHVGDRRIPFLAVPATDPDSVEACSQGFVRKYGTRSASARAMVQPETLATTLRLEPA